MSDYVFRYVCDCGSTGGYQYDVEDAKRARNEHVDGSTDCYRQLHTRIQRHPADEIPEGRVVAQCDLKQLDDGRYVPVECADRTDIREGELYRPGRGERA